MKISIELCTEIELRLVDAPRATDDPSVAAHVRSCLRCFRTASEMRDVPHISALLREMDQPDPGDLFWAKFPTSVADAWERRRAPAAPAVVSTRRPTPARSIISRWLQLPIAALSGAAVAAVLVLAVVHRSQPAAPVSGAPVPVAAAVMEAHDDDEAGGVLGEEDPLDSLELADVSAVVARMDVESSSQGDEGSEPGPSPMEEVELLEADDLRAVAQALRARSQI